jgi:hypothetical protein
VTRVRVGSIFDEEGRMSVIVMEVPGWVGASCAGFPAETVAAATVPQLDMVDREGDDSFPCSDPPSWTLGSRGTDA